MSSTLLIIGPLVVDNIYEGEREDFEPIPGGNAVIAGAAASRFGLKVTLLGQCGNDRAGESLTSKLQEHHVDTRFLLSSRGESKVCSIRIDREGEWHRGWVGDAVLYLVPGHGSFSTNYDRLHIAGANSMARTVPHICEELVRRFRDAGKKVSFGLNRVSQDEREALHGWMEEKDIVFMNDVEFCELTGSCSDDSGGYAGAILASRYGCGVITCGSNGAVARNGLKLFSCSSPQVTVRSTVGAGDVFSGVFLARVDQGASTEEALREAVRCASESCESHLWDDWLPRETSLPE